MKTIFLAIAIAIFPAAYSQTGIFHHNADIGNPKLPGSALFDKSTKQYTLTGSGYNIWFKRDEFHFLYNEMKGDFVLTAHLGLKGAGKDAHRKIGWMVRASTDDDAAHISAVVHGDGLTVLQWRTKKGAAMRDPEDEIFSKIKSAPFVQLERKAGTFIMRIGNTADSLQELGRTDQADLPDKVLAGLFICSHNPDVAETGTASDVMISHEVPRK